MSKKEIKFNRVRKVLSGIKQLDKKLKSLKTCGEEFESRTPALAKNLQKKQIIEKLKETPVEELSSAKMGIKVSLLRQSGYKNIYQLYSASAPELERINGIGPKGAKNIIAAVGALTDSISTNSKLRIPADPKSHSADLLVENLYKVKESGKVRSEALKLYENEHDSIRSLTKAAKPASNALLWALSSEEKRNVALQSFEALEGMLSGGYANRVDELYARKQQILKAKHNEYWKDFSSNSASFYAAYERTKGKNGQYRHQALKKAEETAIANGLPAELAVAIGKVELNLDGLEAQLRPYQEYGVQYILSQGAVLLGDDMGLGKTVEAIASMVSLHNSGLKRFLVVCPASVLTNWLREVEKFSDLEAVKIYGSDADEVFDNWAQQGGVGITTYETTAKLTFEDTFKFDMLVVDEAHYIKNPKAKRTVSVMNLRAHTDRALFMTGTALENNVEEMCFLIGCLQPDAAASVRGSTGFAMADNFRTKISGVYFRRKKEDVLDELPEKTEQTVWCDLGKEESAVYADSVQESNFMAMRQVSWNVNDPALSCKAEQLVNICNEAVNNGRKVIVFSFFKNTLDQAQRALDVKCFGPISGSVSPADRQKIVDDFTNYESGAVLAAQIGAGGTGLNIQAASVIVLCEPQLKPSIENQAIARAYRMGQVNKVIVYRLLCEKSVDKQIMNMLEMKKQIFDEFADKSVSGEESVQLAMNDCSRIVEEEKKRLS
ncbi:MAG: DEAD/DEAH box helicase family protein [Clostridiales bacterium]|nr:DEAD/DEAH box helicase family protein [Clostridiales bacterium]